MKFLMPAANRRRITSGATSSPPSRVRAVESIAHDKLVVLRDLVEDRETQVRERRAEAFDELPVIFVTRE